MKGITKTPPPMTTFWPDRSVETSPVSGLRTSLPLRPVMMNASLGLRPLYLLASSRPTRIARTMSPMIAVTIGLMSGMRGPFWLRAQCVSSRGSLVGVTSTAVGERMADTQTSVPVSTGWSALAVILRTWPATLMVISP